MVIQTFECTAVSLGNQRTNQSGLKNAARFKNLSGLLNGGASNVSPTVGDGNNYPLISESRQYFAYACAIHLENARKLFLNQFSTRH